MTGRKSAATVSTNGIANDDDPVITVLSPCAQAIELPCELRRVVSFCVPSGKTTIRSIFIRLAQTDCVLPTVLIVSRPGTSYATLVLFVFATNSVSTCLVYDVLSADVCIVVVGLRVKRKKANMNHVNYVVLMRNILSISYRYSLSNDVCRPLLDQSLAYRIISFFFFL